MAQERKILSADLSEEGVLRLTMDDQKTKNALSEEMMTFLMNELHQAMKNHLIKVIVIAAKGDVFSAGHDLKEITQARKDTNEGELYFKKLFDQCSSLMQFIVTCSKPIIAEIAGTATAAGCQLISSCDLAYSSRRARYATPGVNIGLFCSTPMVPLSRTVGKKQAMEMLLTGDLINANKALRIGLINDVFEEDSLKENVFQIAKKISSKSSNTIKIGKEAFYKQKDMNLEDAYTFTSNVMTENMLHDDSKEGIEAFLEKREPNWKE